MNIKRRGMECDTKCVCCQRLDEDGAHLFLRCKEIKKIWRELKIEEERLILCECRDATEVVHQMLNMREGKAVLISCLLWRWWTYRNKINAKDKPGGQDNLVHQIRVCVGESEQFCKNVPSDSAPSTTAVWKAPTGDKLKINTDGAFDVVRKTGGWGFVVRDNTGQIRGAGAGALQLVASAAQAEAYACEEVVRSATDWGMVDVSIETDARNLVRALHGTEFDRTLE
jgi:hypothetical protein